MNEDYGHANYDPKFIDETKKEKKKSLSREEAIERAERMLGHRLERKVSWNEDIVRTHNNLYDKMLPILVDKILEIAELLKITEEQNDTIILVDGKNKELQQKLDRVGEDNFQKGRRVEIEHYEKKLQSLKSRILGLDIKDVIWKAEGLIKEDVSEGYSFWVDKLDVAIKQKIQKVVEGHY